MLLAIMIPTSDLAASANHLENYLQKNPSKASKVAVSHYRRWTTLETQNAQLETQNKFLTQQNQQLKADNSRLLKHCERLTKQNHRLKQSKSPQPVSLRTLLNSKKS